MTASDLVVSVPTDQLAADLQPLPDGVDLVVWPMDGPAPRDRFDMVVPPYMSMAKVLERLDGVEVGLVQGQSIGYDGVARLLPAGLVFANAASVHEASTAELAVGLAIAAQRGIDRFAVDTATAAGRRSSPTASPTAACSCSAGEVSVRPSRRAWRASRWSSPPWHREHASRAE